MDEIVRFWHDLSGRVGGPLNLRLILQPVVASVLAIRAGLRDARTGRPAYLWSIVTHPFGSVDLQLEGWKAVGKVFVLATILDVVYQVMVFRWVYPGEALLVAFLLACVPYLIVRGPVNRIARRWTSATSSVKANRP